ncbi:unnamed protein product [Pleuronectes platessa]|uniref:Uncharacterized protein n=1 Tax=Pleuronectes platessa TaxID=8262 RepID=A0A9N7VNI6_PLEPL|nr:unnamed protein product [Pleuronectes platessa]
MELEEIQMYPVRHSPVTEHQPLHLNCICGQPSAGTYSELIPGSALSFPPRRYLPVPLATAQWKPGNDVAYQFNRRLGYNTPGLKEPHLWEPLSPQNARNIKHYSSFGFGGRPGTTGIHHSPKKSSEHTEPGGALAPARREGGQLAREQEVLGLIGQRETPLGHRSQREVASSSKKPPRLTLIPRKPLCPGERHLDGRVTAYFCPRLLLPEGQQRGGNGQWTEACHFMLPHPPRDSEWESNGHAFQM